MKRGKVTLTAQVILQIDAGTHEVVRDNGNLYILMQQEEYEEVKTSTPTPKKEEVKPVVHKAEVADDTKVVKGRAKKEEPKPIKKEVIKEEEDEDDLVEIPEAAWPELEEGDLVLARLNMEGEDGEKLWEAEVIGMTRPKGSKKDRLNVKFQEDGAEDYLRDGDKLFEYKEII